MLELKGNTAAYMQYAVARVEGILAKGGIDRPALRAATQELRLADPAERALALELLRFGEVLEDVEADSRPNLLTAWLFGLAGRYSAFYDTLPVLKAEDPDRGGRGAHAPPGPGAARHRHRRTFVTPAARHHRRRAEPEVQKPLAPARG
jgi:arginyl-tRNA synthetase